jgi:hypothetical protein
MNSRIGVTDQQTYTVHVYRKVVKYPFNLRHGHCKMLEKIADCGLVPTQVGKAAELKLEYEIPPTDCVNAYRELWNCDCITYEVTKARSRTLRACLILNS